MGRGGAGGEAGGGPRQVYVDGGPARARGPAGAGGEGRGTVRLQNR